MEHNAAVVALLCHALLYSTLLYSIGGKVRSFVVAFLASRFVAVVAVVAVAEEEAWWSGVGAVASGAPPSSTEDIGPLETEVGRTM